MTVGGQHAGTGFFVAPGRVLTCAHVARPNRGAFGITWRGSPSPARLVLRRPRRGEGDPHPFPDLALLGVDCPGHPCVRLDAQPPARGQRSDSLRAAGFTRVRDSGGPPALTPMGCDFEGVYRGADGPLLQVKLGQAVEGMSGAPLLSERTFRIVGMIKETRDRTQLTGAWALPATWLLDRLPALCRANQEFHSRDARWSDAARRARPVSTAELEAAGLYVWTEEDFSAGLAETPDAEDDGPFERGESVDVTMLRSGRLGNLQREFEELGSVFEKWLAPAPARKRGPERLRVLWLEGEPGPYRSKALLACMARTRLGDRDLYDAGGELRPAIAGWTMSVHATGFALPPLIGLDLPGELPGDAWVAVRGAVTNARKQRLPKDTDPFPRMIVAGTAEQAQSLHRTFEALVEIRPVDLQGNEGPRPYSFHGMTGLESATLSREHVYNKGLPITTRVLFGREKELDGLTRAWGSERIRVLSIVAYGGTGKSALVNKWLTAMREQDWKGARRVYAWSFYSQGTRENLVSADPFVNHALSWLGDRSARSLNPWAKGRELAKLIKQHDFLLVLDGLEPLQHPLSAPDVGGQLTDDSISALLEELARPSRDGDPDWNGLCVITTRVPLTDLRPFQAAGRRGPGTVVQLDLGNMDDVAGAALLKHLLVRRDEPAAGDGHGPVASSVVLGPDFPELQKAIRFVGRHALAINLLGNYLRDRYNGDLARRFDLRKLTVEEREGGHARRVMDSYVRWFEQDGRSEELALLRIMGLFDRPAYPEAIGALLADSHFVPFKAGLDRVGGEQWDRSLGALRRMGLLNHESQGLPGTIDAHPLVREHFRDELLKLPGDAWRQGNRTLFRYYRSHAPRRPKTSAGMSSLYAAVTHGCAADRHQEVFDRILLPRVWRDRRTNFSTRRLGMTGSDLVALSNYFQDRQWRRLRGLELSPHARVLVLTNAGVRLRQLGRLLEARQSFDAVIEEIDPDAAGPEDLENASYAAAQNCELLVVAGKLTGAPGEREAALFTGQRAVEYSDGGDDAYFSMHARSSLAEVHFMLGDLHRAEALFEQARAIERDRHPRPGFLYSQSLYRYGYYLIETGRAQQILDDERHDPDWGTNGDDSSLLSQAIRLLILGAARRSLIEGGRRAPELLERAEGLLDDSISEFRTAGYPDYIVRGLLERAHFYRVRHQAADYGLALEDLDRASYEAGRGHMDLLHADVQLERSACYLEFLERMSPRERSAVASRLARDLQEAAAKIQGFGYGRREEMATALRARAMSFDVVRRAMETP